jgi:hypothetical protein
MGDHLCVVQGVVVRNDRRDAGGARVDRAPQHAHGRVRSRPADVRENLDPAARGAHGGRDGRDDLVLLEQRAFARRARRHDCMDSLLDEQLDVCLECADVDGAVGAEGGEEGDDDRAAGRTSESMLRRVHRPPIFSRRREP